MSLINQMLKDLETRSRPPVNSEIALSGLDSAWMEESESEWKSYAVFFIFIIAALCALWFMQHRFHFFTSTKKATASSSAVITTTPAKTSLSEPPSVVPPTSLLMAMALQVQQEVTNLRFLLNKDTLYDINSDPEHHQLTITFDRTHLVADLPPLNYMDSAIQDISMTNTRDGDLKIIMTLQPTAELKHVDWVVAEHSPELQLDFAYKNTATSPAVTNEAEPVANHFVKTPVSEFNAQQQYEHALTMMRSGDFMSAKVSLTTIVEKFPMFYQARKSLVDILIQENDYGRADELLRVGLRYDPDYLPFIELKAHLFVAQNKIHEALHVLEVSAPNVKKDPDYLSFLAALYQRTDQPQMAAQLYQQLLSTQTPRGVWWVGLGVALESLGKGNAAKEAFLRASNSDNLTPELRAFVANRLNEA